jgi:hypothetical protein
MPDQLMMRWYGEGEERKQDHAWVGRASRLCQESWRVEKAKVGSIVLCPYVVLYKGRLEMADNNMFSLR